VVKNTKTYKFRVLLVLKALLKLDGVILFCVYECVCYDLLIKIGSLRVGAFSDGKQTKKKLVKISGSKCRLGYCVFLNIFCVA